MVSIEPNSVVTMGCDVSAIDDGGTVEHDVRSTNDDSNHGADESILSSSSSSSSPSSSTKTWKTSTLPAR